MSTKNELKKEHYMAAKGRGGGKTPKMLVDLLNKTLEEKSLRSISKATGLGLAPLSRYTKGTSEPSQATLEKLAEYFNVSVPYLRGDQSPIRKLIGRHEVELFQKVTNDLINLYDRSPGEQDSLAIAMSFLLNEINNSLLQDIAGVEEENETKLNLCKERLNKIITEFMPVIEVKENIATVTFFEK